MRIEAVELPHRQERWKLSDSSLVCVIMKASQTRVTYIYEGDSLPFNADTLSFLRLFTRVNR